VSFCTHASLSHVELAGEDDGCEELPLDLAVVDTAFGAPKNEVMEPLPFGFLGSVTGNAEAFRLRLMMSGRRTLNNREDSLIILFVEL
jgi:hypothetical protein